MIFTGGACQGKEAFARSLFGADEETFKRNTAKGGEDDPARAFDRPYVTAYHLMIRDLLQGGADPDDFTRRLLAADPRVVIMDEIGCGMIPAEKKGRDYRDAVGRCGQILAAGAGEVYRVVCGIGMRIK